MLERKWLVIGLIIFVGSTAIGLLSSVQTLSFTVVNNSGDDIRVSLFEGVTQIVGNQHISSHPLANSANLPVPYPGQYELLITDDEGDGLEQAVQAPGSFTLEPDMLQPPQIQINDDDDGMDQEEDIANQEE